MTCTDFDSVVPVLVAMLARWRDTGLCRATPDEDALFRLIHEEIAATGGAEERTRLSEALSELASCPHHAATCLTLLLSNPFDRDGPAVAAVEARVAAAVDPRAVGGTPAALPIAAEAPARHLIAMATGAEAADMVVLVRSWAAILAADPAT